MTQYLPEVQRRIARLVESVENDRARSGELFQYVWTMMCVRQGLMRRVREERREGRVHIICEEVRSGRRRTAIRPDGLDEEIEDLAVEALARIMGLMKLAS